MTFSEFVDNVKDIPYYKKCTSEYLSKRFNISVKTVKFYKASYNFYIATEGLLEDNDLKFAAENFINELQNKIQIPVTVPDSEDYKEFIEPESGEDDEDGYSSTPFNEDLSITNGWVKTPKLNDDPRLQDTKDAYVSAYMVNKKDEVAVKWYKRTGLGFEMNEEAKLFVQDCLKTPEYLKPFVFTENHYFKPYDIINPVDYVIFWISDTHVGMTNKNNFAKSKWTLDEFKSRMKEIVKYVPNCSEFTIAFLGDGIDGWDGMTTRKSHPLDQDTDNRGQFITLLDSFKELFMSLEELRLSKVIKNIRFVSVSESNHSGDFDYLFAEMFSMWLKAYLPHVVSEISPEYIGKFMCGDNTFVYCHGKDAKHQKHGFPLNLNDKTEVFFRRVFDFLAVTVSNKLHVYSGDLHQDSYNRQVFSYNKTASFCSGSDWQITNFASNCGGVSFTKLLANGTIERGIIDFKTK